MMSLSFMNTSQNDDAVPVMAAQPTAPGRSGQRPGPYRLR